LWSEVKQSCVRLWEAGIGLEALNNENRTYTAVATIIFADDSTRAELFLPEGNTQILDKTEQGTWKNAEWELRYSDSWMVTQGTNTIFAEKKN